MKWEYRVPNCRELHARITQRSGTPLPQFCWPRKRARALAARTNAFQSILSQLGQKGGELVDPLEMQRIFLGTGGTESVLFFKRPKKDGRWRLHLPFGRSKAHVGSAARTFWRLGSFPSSHLSASAAPGRRARRASSRTPRAM